MGPDQDVGPGIHDVAGDRHRDDLARCSIYSRCHPDVCPSRGVPEVGGESALISVYRDRLGDAC